MHLQELPRGSPPAAGRLRCQEGAAASAQGREGAQECLVPVPAHDTASPPSSHPPQPARALPLTSGVMDPQSWLMRVSWCCSVFPCMMGLRVHISAMMQPAPQRSMGGP